MMEKMSSMVKIVSTRIQILIKRNYRVQCKSVNHGRNFPMMMNDKDEQPENGDWKSLEAQIVVMILNDDDDENDPEEDDTYLRMGTGVEVSRSASENCPTATPTRHNTRP